MALHILVGKYVVQQEIARGGMGVIYKALDRSLKRVVAIKMVHAHLTGDSSFVERFLREARAMARLQHDTIVTIYAVEEDHGTPLLVMEYFPSTNLRQRTKNQPRLPFRDIVRITEQLADALAFAHAHGIIHRDIKPANVLIDTRGKVKLTDFGIASALDESPITSDGKVIGTPEYMSPEQACPEQACGTKVDGRSDLYSVGILLYEMLTGKTPYAEDSKTAILGKLAFNKQELSLTFPPDVPSSLQGVVRDLLRRQPDDRTADAETLAAQLHEILYTLPQTPPPSAPDEPEPTIVSTPHLPSGEDPTRAISPGTEPVPASPKSPEQSQAPPKYKRPEPIVPSPSLPVPAPTAFPIKSLIAGGFLLMAVLAGLVWYLGSQPETGTSDDKSYGTSGDIISPPPRRPDQKIVQLEARLKEREENLSKLETLLGGAVNRLQAAEHTPDCSDLKTLATETYGEYEDAAREVNQVRFDLEREPVAATSRPIQLDMECEKPPPSSPVDNKPKPGPKPKSKPGPARPTPPVQVVTAFPDPQLRSLLDTFKQAYERRDLETLRSISRMSEARQRNVEIMFGHYETFKLSIVSITPQDDGAAAVLVIDTAITAAGETVALNPIAKNIRLHVTRQGEGWDKMVW